MNRLPTGPQRVQNYCKRSSQMLHRAMARYGLAIAEMEALTALASTVMESRSLSISQAREIWMDGLKGFDSITNSEVLRDQVTAALLMGHGNVRYAVVETRPRHSKRVIIYLRDYEAPEVDENRLDDLLERF